MSTLSDLNTRLNEVLKKSETRNLTTTQRERALNDALIFDVNNYRPWDFQVENTFTQAVDGIINIPSNFKKEYSLRYGVENNRFNEYNLIDQTKFLNEIDFTATITEYNDVQVLKVFDNTDKGVDIENKTSDTDLGLNDDVTRENLYETFITATSKFKGSILKLKTVGAPTGNITLSLHATTASLPTGSALATKTISISELSTAYEFFYFYMLYTTTVDTEYALVLSGDYALSTTDYVAWEHSTTSVTDGTRGIYDGANYTTATGDMYFITYNDVFEFQYSKRLISMTSSTSSTGLGGEFDEAITMLAAARLLARQAGGRDTTKLALAHELRYGTQGSFNRPTPDSAYGKLNILWDEYAVRTERPFRKMSNIYENRVRRGYYSDPSLNR